jgi:L-asparaginase
MNTETSHVRRGVRQMFAAALLSSWCVVGTLAQEIPTYAPLPPKPAAGAVLPTIVLMSMGGTIASRGEPRLNVTNYGGKGAPRVDPEHWLRDLPELADIAHIRLEDQRAPQDRVASETFEDWRRVAQRLNALAADPAVSGIVVTHGTNTMAETAYYMNLVVRTQKPIVFVGSQRPWTGLSGDGPRNLYDAVRVAASKEAWNKGVLHCMNQLITPAREVNKLSAYRVQTFRGIDSGAIGVADPDAVRFYREPVRRHTGLSEFAGVDFAGLPKVEVAYAYRDAPGYVIDAMVAHGVRGIVVDGTGAGSPTSSQTEAIERAQQQGVIVVATARTHGGRVQDTPRRREARIVPGDNLVPEKARILLQLALARGANADEVTRVFSEY